MAIFGVIGKKNKEKQTNSIKKREMLRQYTFVSSTHFRGFKKAYLVAYGYGNYTKNTDILVKKYGQKFESLPVSLDIYKSDSFSDQPEYAELVVDGLPIGAFFNSNSYYDELIHGRISQIYIRNEIQNKVSSDGIYTENHAQVFIKLD